MADALFIDREKELRFLKLLLKKKTASLIVIKGRRRIGKSRLIEEFSKGQPFYHFSGLPPEENTTAQDQRDEFSQQLSTQTGFPVLRFDDWHQIFVVLAEKIHSGRQIVLFDEISWMGSKDVNFLGKLKNAWDMYFKKNPQLILVLCGSVSQWIEKNILSSTGFFGRVAQELSVEELPLKSCSRMLDAVGFKGSPFEKLMILGLTGGVPWYLENIQPKLSAIENMRRLCFEKNGLLVKEYDKIFHDLFSARGTTSQKIVACLVSGPKEYEQISEEIGYASGGPLSHYLEELVASGFVVKDGIWSLKTQKTLKLVRYRLRDNYLRFYLKYIAPKRSKIEKGQYANISISTFPEWETIMGLQFENLVLNNRDLILNELHIDPADIVEDNPYFQHKTTRQKGCQIDYLIQTKFKTLYLCEIKFSTQPIGLKVAEEVDAKIKRLNHPRGFVVHPVLIHIGEMSRELVESDYFFQTLDFASFL